jgi:hypothetical protein
MRRRDVVVRCLLAMRIPDADNRVTVSPDLAPEWRAGETPAVYNDNGGQNRNNSGNGGGNGYGGGNGGWSGGGGWVGPDASGATGGYAAGSGGDNRGGGAGSSSPTVGSHGAGYQR